MYRIQEDYFISEQIIDIVNEYLEGDYGEEDVLAITPKGRNLSIIGDRMEMIDVTPDTEIHPISSLVRDDENGGLEADVDKIDEIASSWVSDIL